MPIILTSFTRATKYPCTAFSVARSQPKGSLLVPLPFLAATGATGEPLRIHDGTPEDFALAYRSGLRSRWPSVSHWLSSLNSEETISLCCWCPDSSPSSSSRKTTGSLLCHNLLIGKLVAHFRPDIPILLDPSRFLSAYPPWRPDSEAAEQTATVPQQLSLF